MDRVDKEEDETHGQFSLLLLMDDSTNSSYNCLEREDTRKKNGLQFTFLIGFPITLPPTAPRTAQVKQGSKDKQAKKRAAYEQTCHLRPALPKLTQKKKVLQKVWSNLKVTASLAPTQLLASFLLTTDPDQKAQPEARSSVQGPK